MSAAGEVQGLHGVVGGFAQEQARLQRLVVELLQQLGSLQSQLYRQQKRQNGFEDRLCVQEGGGLSAPPNASPAESATPMSPLTPPTPPTPRVPSTEPIPLPGDANPRNMTASEDAELVRRCKERYVSPWCNSATRKKGVAAALCLPAQYADDFHSKRVHLDVKGLDARRKWALWHILENVPLSRVASRAWKQATPNNGEDYNLPLTRLGASSLPPNRPGAARLHARFGAPVAPGAGGGAGGGGGAGRRQRQHRPRCASRCTLRWPRCRLRQPTPLRPRTRRGPRSKTARASFRSSCACRSAWRWAFRSKRHDTTRTLLCTPRTQS